MRAAAVVATGLLVSGCAEYMDMNSDAFVQKPGQQERFYMDARACELEAENQRAYQLRGIAADEGERHRIYSKALSACMTSRGHPLRVHWYNLGEGYSW